MNERNRGQSIVPSIDLSDIISLGKLIMNFVKYDENSTLTKVFMKKFDITYGLYLYI